MVHARPSADSLTPRAMLLLRLIVQTTVHGGDGRVKRYWVPKNHSQYVGATAVTFDKSDIPLLRGLNKYRLIEPQPSETAHAYASTQAGERLVNEVYPS